MKNFRINVLLRVALIAVLCLALAWGVLRTQWLLTPIVCVAVILLVLVDLVRYVERTAREFTGFLTFVANHDFATPVAIPQKGRVFEELQNAYRLLAGEFRRLNLQKAANHQYLEAVVEHVGVALVCLDPTGIVTMMNEPARKLFGLPHLNSARSLARFDARLPALVERLGDGDRTLLDVRRGEDSLQLVLYATTFELLQQRYKLVSFQNIRDELERQEIESWQKLIRVLTHEIMNSVTPIISLSRVIHDALVDESAPSATLRQIGAREQEDLVRSVAAINTRSNGLLEFVQAYRSFAALPPPVLADVAVCGLFERAHTLLAQELEGHGIALVVDCADTTLAIRADGRQIEQVLLNLLRNSIDALGERDVIDALAERPAPRIELRGHRDEQGRALLQVSDNGPGVDPAHLDNIFVPFFTTKRNGTGVGLSISRQIVQRNRGVISVRSAPGEGSTFTLRFQ